MSIDERSYQDLVTEINSRVWKIRDLYDSALRGRTREEDLEIQEDEKTILKTRAKALCDEIKALSDELKAMIV